MRVQAAQRTVVLSTKKKLPATPGLEDLELKGSISRGASPGRWTNLALSANLPMAISMPSARSRLSRLIGGPARSPVISGVTASLPPPVRPPVPLFTSWKRTAAGRFSPGASPILLAHDGGKRLGGPQSVFASVPRPFYGVQSLTLLAFPSQKFPPGWLWRASKRGPTH